MIYFDKKTQNEVIEKLKSLLNIGSLLLLGHSESITNRVESLGVVASSVYKKG
jgi:chemotaxis protein methyltransferase CheR